MEEKLLLYLVEEVASWPLKAKSHKTGNNMPQDETQLAWRSIYSYVTAIMDLYQVQKVMGMNSHQSPQEDNVREYLKVL